MAYRALVDIVGTNALMRLLWLSVMAAVLTIALKVSAWYLTGSVGLLSDAAESLINLVAALIALMAFRWAAQPPDEEHAYGHAKAEYVSAGIEGALICAAAVTIAVVGFRRVIDPQPITDVGLGLALTGMAALINLAVGLKLVRAGRAHRALAVEADGRHLLSDVLTSAAVIVGVAVVWVTGWARLDGIIAIAVAAHIVVMGVQLVRRSTGGLMDRAIDAAGQETIAGVLEEFRTAGVAFHALRTRQAGRRSFVSMHILVPGEWTVARGHDLAEDVEARIRAALPGAVVFTHIEPAEDPRSFADTALDRGTTS
jgi:cation diffusion facilitator family transporter